jgi:hypothetical protein
MNLKSVNIGGRSVAPGGGLEALARERESARAITSHEQFHSYICQCCEYVQKEGEQPCLCDGLPWFLDGYGNLECQAHKFARALGLNTKTFDLGALK